MALTDTFIRNSKPKEKTYKVTDERGLFILINSSGSKLWRFKYSFDGKEKGLSLGSYPEISLKDARERRDDARKLLANDIDPGANRKAQKAAKRERAANSFEIVAREWFAKQIKTWSAIHANRVIARLQGDIFPWLGSRPIADITAPELLGVIQRIEKRGALETAHRAMSNCSQVFRYAVATGRAGRDPSFDLRGALPPVKGSHFAAQTEPDKVAPLLRAFDAYQGSPQVMCALRLAPLVFVRPGELRHAEWSKIDFNKAEWRYLATKTNTEHIVPLSKQALALLRELHPITGHGRYLFPSARSECRPMSDNAILSAMRRMDIDKEEMSGHGFRAMARTILDEVLGVRPDFIEHQLAHAVKDPNGRAYNRTAHLPERRAMMQQWADYLDGLKKDTQEALAA